MKLYACLLASAITAGIVMSPGVIADDRITEAIADGKVSLDINMRYEDVSTDLVDSDSMTLRTRLGFTSASYEGFNAVVEVEDVRDLFGIDDDGALVPDPEVTEVDQAFIQYKNKRVTAKLGRQVIALDGHRFVGHVGWRQDRQTFDAARIILSPAENLTVDLMHLYKRNRIFAEQSDADSSDNLLNISYNTGFGTLVGYAYLLDDETLLRQSDTYGASFKGKTQAANWTLFYAAEVATQDATQNGAEFTTDYLLLEAGLGYAGINAKFGYEALGSDQGAASFTTPLSTLHKFNGWADVFVGGTFTPTAMPDGLRDYYFTLNSQFAGFSLSTTYHDFQSERGSVNYGNELNFQAMYKFAKHYIIGFKYAAYSDDGFSAVGDVDRLWTWVGAKF